MFAKLCGVKAPLSSKAKVKNPKTNKWGDTKIKIKKRRFDENVFKTPAVLMFWPVRVLAVHIGCKCEASWN